MFYIKRIMVSGDSKDPATIEFGPGLNIIYGPSNCGKSYVADCVDFMFGANATRIPTDIGYDTVAMVVESEKGIITMRRKFDSTDVEVSSTDYRIESGKYTTGKASKTKSSLSLLWLKLIGIKEPVKIAKAASKKTQQLTLRTFYHMLLIKETPVFQEKSILLPVQVVNETAFKAALLYLITGKNYLPDEVPGDNNNRDIRNKAIGEYIREQLESLDKRKIEIIKAQCLSPEEIQKNIDTILLDIESAEGAISLAVSRIRELAAEIILINDQLAEDANLYEKYQVLREQYASDIRRITFIAEGELKLPGDHIPTKCPFCSGDLPKAVAVSCADAAKAEIERLVPQIQDLDNAETSLISEQKALKARLSELLAERAYEENRLNIELRPRLQDLKKSLAEYSSAIELSKEVAVISAYEASMKERLLTLDDETPEEWSFDALSHLGDDFSSKLKDILLNILAICNFTNLDDVFLSYDRFDICVNGQSKDTYGKGYRAFLNTIMAIGIQEYIAKYGKFSPRFLLIDSPILSLKETGDEKAPDSMKLSLFQYMVDNQSDRQTIIIENDIPPANYKNTTLIHFTKKDEGRYGFLDGLK